MSARLGSRAKSKGERRMKRRMLSMVTATIAIGLLVPTVCLAIPDIETHTFTGLSADGGFYRESEGGAYESVGVWAGAAHSVDTIAGTENHHGWEQFGIVTYEIYTPESAGQPETFMAIQSKEPMQFNCERDLSGATLLAPEATADLIIWYDEMPWEGDEMVPSDVETKITVNIQATWEGNGPALRERDFSSEPTEGGFMITRTMSVRRNATCEASITGSDGTVWFDDVLDEAGISNTRGTGVLKGTF